MITARETLKPVPMLCASRAMSLALFCALLACRPILGAQPSAAPLFLIQPSGADVKVERRVGAGIIEGMLDSWVEAYMNKRGAAQSSAFRHVTAGVDWDALAAAEFSCIGTTAGEKCHEIVRFEGDEKALIQKLQALGTERAFVLTVFQLYDGAGYKARATVRDIELRQQKLQDLRLFTAVYETLPPQQILEQGKSMSSMLWSFWADGSPESRIIVEGRKSLKELAAMLTALDEAIPLERGKPTGWKELKPISALEAEGRAHCHGLCGGTRVFKEAGLRVWLANTAVGSNNYGGYGWTLVSVDENAALANANFAAYTISPILDWKWAVLPTDKE